MRPIQSAKHLNKICTGKNLLTSFGYLSNKSFRKPKGGLKLQYKRETGGNYWFLSEK